ncbi:transmembrane protein 59-like isoform X1 [Portunus trituberculatus]|uniref:transmembrane protein 59-like isoform X1 n=1 Tax=Portunus trituberculatus TaxID=210409 RepID=UPI001E1D095E|nr:transmembrane protein 59-like isoform X1 [Portunus trituberculatus]
MASTTWNFFALLSLFSLSGALGGFQGLLGDPKGCEESCLVSYAPHTNPDGGDESQACSRGCRLYTITEFVAFGEKLGQKNAIGPLRTPKESCFNACVDAYNETSGNTVACKFGCEAQETSRLEKKQKEQEEEEESHQSIHLLSPLVQVRAVYSSLVGAVHIVRSSLVTYFTAEDNSIVAVESPPEILVEVLNADEEVKADGGDGVDGAKLSPPLPRFLSSEGAEGVDSGEPSVVRCVSQRLGVPPPLLVASALVLVLFTIYVIFAVCSAAPAKTRKEALSVQADPLPLPIKLVRPEDLTRLSLMEEDDLQAPPLPTKVKLPDSDV